MMVLNLVPDQHAAAILQAFYIAAGLCVLLAFGVSTTAVYFVLQPFLKPMLWALLIGSVLYPFKQRSVVIASGWLSEIRDSDTLLIVGILSLPFRALDCSAEWMKRTVLENLKMFLSLTFGMALVYIIQHYYSLADVIWVFESLFYMFKGFLSLFEQSSTTAMVLVIISVLGLIYTIATQLQNELVFYSLWLVLVFGVICFFGSFKVVLIFFTLAVTVVALAIRQGWIKDENEPPSDSSDNVDVKTTPSDQSSSDSPLLSTSTESEHSDSECEAGSSSNHYIYGVFCACLIVLVWTKTWLLIMLSIPLAYSALKTVASYLKLDTLPSGLLDYKDQISPPPFQWISKVLIQSHF